MAPDLLLIAELCYGQKSHWFHYSLYATLSVKISLFCLFQQAFLYCFMVAMLGEGARSSELLVAMITVASDGGKCSHSTLVNECLKYPSGFRGRYFHFLAA